MTKFEKVAISRIEIVWGLVFFFLPLQGQFAENANKGYHVCFVFVLIVV